MHGETVVEPVEPGTNRAAIDCEDVDVLAHPGLLDPQDAARAAARGCFIEVSGRKGHGFANGHVVRTALAAGAPLILDSDAHEPQDLLTPAFARTVLLGAALPESELQTVLLANPQALLARRAPRPGWSPGREGSSGARPRAPVVRGTGVSARGHSREGFGATPRENPPLRGSQKWQERAAGGLRR